MILFLRSANFRKNHLCYSNGMFWRLHSRQIVASLWTIRRWFIAVYRRYFITEHLSPSICAAFGKYICIISVKAPQASFLVVAHDSSTFAISLKSSNKRQRYKFVSLYNHELTERAIK